MSYSNYFILWLLGDFNPKYFSYFRIIIEKLDIPLIKWETIHYGNSLYRIFQWILVFEATGISRLSLFPNLKINIPLNNIQKLFLEVNWRLLWLSYSSPYLSWEVIEDDSFLLLKCLDTIDSSVPNDSSMYKVYPERWWMVISVLILDIANNAHWVAFPAVSQR